MLTIGILNLQGAVSEHYDITKKAIEQKNINAEVKTVRYADDVTGCNGLIISGGESTVIGKILFERGIDKIIKNEKIPVFGTCAGMVLLGKKTNYEQPTLGIMDIEVVRNSFGRQKDSFETELEILGDKYPGVFIRAPTLKSYDKTKKDIKVLCKVNDTIVAIQQGHNLAMSFHPELTNDTRLHEYFIQEISKCVE
jgi:5'-phosphate synthase pdxT subunit